VTTTADTGIQYPKLCEHFTKKIKKRGPPRPDEYCAVCETLYTEHFSEKYPDRGEMKPVLHQEKVQERFLIIPGKKRRVRVKRTPTVMMLQPTQEEPETALEPAVEPEPIIEPEPEPIIDRMSCGHLLTCLVEGDEDGQGEYCGQCRKTEQFADKMEAWYRQENYPNVSDEDWPAIYANLCDWD
jgi:hypothetical protein